MSNIVISATCSTIDQLIEWCKKSNLLSNKTTDLTACELAVYVYSEELLKILTFKSNKHSMHDLIIIKLVTDKMNDKYFQDEPATMDTCQQILELYRNRK